MTHVRVRCGAGGGAVLLALTLALVAPWLPRAAAAPQRPATTASGPCAGAIELRSPTGQITCTHGPDPAPPGIDIKRPRPPLPASRTEGTAPTAVSPVCTGDGTSGARVQLVYARPPGHPARFDAYAASFQTWAAQIDAGVNVSA